MFNTKIFSKLKRKYYPKRIYNICFYAPAKYVEKIKTAMFAKGAGNIGAYSCCAWETVGQGQFLVEEHNNPYYASIPGIISKIKEIKVEVLCDGEFVEEAILAMKEEHPYETPGYIIVEVIF